MKIRLKRAALNAVLMTLTIAAAVAVGSQVPKVLQKVQERNRTGDFSEHLAGQPQRLTLYGTTTCPACTQARAYLKAEGIPFNDMLIDKSKAAERMYDKLGENGVPVLVSKRKYVLGFMPTEYKSLAGAGAR